MRIDSIIPYGKTRSKVLFEEGLTILFYNGEISRMRLAEGCEISQDQYERVILPLLEKRCRERIVFILKSADKTEAELRRKLKEGFYPREVIDRGLEWARSKHYVDDARFAENYLRYHGSGKSRKKLMYDLMNKGLDRDLAVRIMDDTEDEDEESKVRRELEKRHYTPDMDDREKQRLISALARKGFSWSVISDALHLD